MLTLFPRFLRKRFSPKCGIRRPHLRTLNACIASIPREGSWLLRIHLPSTLLPAVSSLARLVLACDDYEKNVTDFELDVLPILKSATMLEEFYLHGHDS